MPDHRESDAKARGSVVRKLNHQAGRGSALMTGADGELGRDGEAVPLVAQPRSGDGDVDGDEQGIVSGLGGPVDQRHGAVPVLPHVQLEPVAAVGCRGGDVLDGGGSHGGQGEGDPGRGGGARPGALAFGLHHAGEARGGNAEGQLDPFAENLPAGIDGRDIAQDGRVELQSGERASRAGQGDLGFCGAVGVVERGFGCASLGDAAQVADGQGRVQPAPCRVDRGSLELHQGTQVVRAGELALHRHDACLLLTGRTVNLIGAVPGLMRILREYSTSAEGLPDTAPEFRRATLSAGRVPGPGSGRCPWQRLRPARRAPAGRRRRRSAGRTARWPRRRRPC